MKNVSFIFTYKLKEIFGQPTNTVKENVKIKVKPQTLRTDSLHFLYFRFF